MASAICQVIVDEFGSAELLSRLADPVYFQALSNALGYDWDSSGSTTVTSGVLASVLCFEKHDMVGVGGKGAASLRTPEMLKALEDYGLNGARLAEVSRRVAKIDSAAIQDGYQLYHHVFFVDREENWTVVQQGLNEQKGDARRYHWTSEGLTSFVDEPHSGIVSGQVASAALDMTSRRSEGCRKTSVDIVNDGPLRTRRLFEEIQSYNAVTLDRWIDPGSTPRYIPEYKVIPQRMNWDAVRRAYERQPSGYEELLDVPGMGAAAVRGLALISELIFGDAPSWSDPVRMTFAFGGKDGVPFPVKKHEYDQAVSFMEHAISEAKLGRREKVTALRRLREFAPPILVCETGQHERESTE